MSQSCRHQADAIDRTGRCELLGPIGQGGMASIHLGRWRDEQDGERLVAVKVLDGQHASDPEFITMFTDEARIAGHIQHPNVVRTLAMTRTEQRLCIVMDLVKGATLAKLFRLARARDEPVSLPIVKRILCDILYGLHAAHRAHDQRGELLRVIHRDMAPDNVMVGVDGAARILDFGLAQAAGRLTQTSPGIVKGKLSYIAPEQLLGESLSPRTDIYGASLVAWQLVTGTKPFSGKSRADLAGQILGGTLPPPSHLMGDDDLDAILMKGLARRPEDRWEDALTMAFAIEQIGGLASCREVGAWVRNLASERLAAMSRVLHAAERATGDARRRTAVDAARLSSLDAAGIGLSSPSRFDRWRQALLPSLAAVGLVLTVPAMKEHVDSAEPPAGGPPGAVAAPEPHPSDVTNIATVAMAQTADADEASADDPAADETEEGVAAGDIDRRAQPRAPLPQSRPLRGSDGAEGLQEEKRDEAAALEDDLPRPSHCDVRSPAPQLPNEI